MALSVRWVLGGILFPLLLGAQKKPVTLEVLQKAASQAGAGGGTVQWSPDGKRFVRQQGGRLMVYEAATRTERALMRLSALTDAATKIPPVEIFGWQNRRVTEQSLQWTPDSRSLVALAGGDVFLIKLSAGGYTQLTATPIAEHDAKLSPDGKKLAYRHNHDLYVAEVGGQRVTRLTHDGSATLLNAELDWVYPEELELGTAYWWSPDSKSLAYLQLDVSREMIHPHVDLLGLFAREEPQRYPKAGTPNADIRLGVVQATGGPTKWMDLGDLRDRLLARVYWMPDSSGLMAMRLNRIQNEMQMLQAQAASGVSAVVLEEKDPFWINVGDDFHFLPRRQQFLMGSERDGYRHLYVFDRNGKVITQVTKGQWEVTGVSLVDEDGGRVFFQSTEESPLERHLYSVSLLGGDRRKLTREKGTHAATVSPTGEYWTDTFSNLTTPTRMTLNDAAGNVIATLREPDTKPQTEYEILPTELVSFRGADGTEFHGRVVRPKDLTPGGKYPAIVMIYGGPHAQTVRDSYAGISWDQVLAQRGFVVWQMDNRGSAGRGHLWESKLYRRFGKRELADQLEGVKHLLSLGFVDADKIGITGWSYGGYMTLYAMLHAPATFKAGVSGAPVTDWRHYDTIYTERYLGLPSENEKGYHDSSPVHYAKNLKGRLMLVHNFGDDNVLYQNSLQMQVELQKAGKQFDLLVYPQKAHGVTGILSRHMREATTAFFEKSLK
ncbi:MAG TPA: DPP IV N-terminal domain-containing protein [Bryobacteraceae bacterium]|nr:DPP IV N-terminal domain-containing protein [Bryobacteraceae bacterium]